MFVLHVKIKMKTGKGAAAEKVFAGPFREAIAAQPGFRAVQFLRPCGDGDYVLSIVFESQPFQQQWVSTDIHQKVWSQMEENFDGYIVTNFETV